MTCRVSTLVCGLLALFAAATAARADNSFVSARAGDAGGAPASSPLTLADAVEQGALELKFIAKSDRRARIIFANKTDEQLDLTLPEAFAGVPVVAQFGGGGGGGGFGGGGGGLGGGGGGGQGVGGGLGGGGGGGLGGGGGQFSIPPEKTRKLDVPVVCLDHGKKDPSSSKPYEMVAVDEYVDRPAVVELLKAFGRGELQHGAAQAAVWALNNDMSWAELAAKQTGTPRDPVRYPYFSRAEIRTAMAYAQEAVRRGRLAEQARESESSMADEFDQDESLGEEYVPELEEPAADDEASEEAADGDSTLAEDAAAAADDE